MAISAEDKNFLVSLYVGYFNRAPDPAGLQFWIDQVEAGRDTNTIAADFAASPEAKSLYPFLTTPDVSSPTSFITAVYANLFNRAPDAAGQAFWEAQLSSGAVSPADAIDAIIKGATTAPDATILANKNIVGLDFATDAGNTPGFTFDLDGTSGSAAKDAISGVTEDSATVTAAQAATDAYLSGVANIGQTFTLTASSPSITEGDTGTKNLTFTLTLDEAPTEATTVNYQTLTSGTATSGDDFDVAAGSVEFAAGQTTATVSVTVNNDTDFEADETVQIQFSGDSLASSVTATGTITNDDVDPDTVAQTFTLTTGVDDITGTAEGDAITGVQTGADDETFGPADAIDGGAGVDTLTIINSEAAAANAVLVENVENIVYRSTAAGATLDMDNFEGETSLTMDRTGAAANVTNLELATSLTLQDLRAAANSTFTYLATDVTGTADAGAVTMDGVEDGAEVDFAGAVETFTVTTSGDASRLDNLVLPGTVTGLTVAAGADLRVDDTFTATALETLTVTGSGAVRIGPALAATVETVDASAATGAITLTMGAADQTITTGTADDVIDMQGNLDDDDTIDLGDGSDTLRIDVQGLAAGAFDLSISNVETFRFDAIEDTNGAINMDNLSVTAITIDGENGGGTDTNDGVITLTDLTTAVTTFDFVGEGADGDPSDDVAFNGIIADYDVSGTDTVASITVNINNGGVTADDMFLDRIEGNNIEALNIVAADIGQASADELTIADIDGMDELTSITVVADGEVIISDIDNSTDDALEILDLSGITAGGATVSAITGYADAGLTITGTGFNDTIVNANNDGGEVSVDLGAGNDAYTSVDATETITTGTGSDTITFQGDANDDDNVITDFTAGNGGDIIDVDTSAVDDGAADTMNTTSYALVAADTTITTGLVVVDNDALGNDAASLAVADVATYLADLDGAGGGVELDANADDEDSYIAVSDGTDTGIYLYVGDGADVAIDAADLTLLVTLQGVSDAGTLTANNFADFL